MIDDGLVMAGNSNIRSCIQHAINGGIGRVNNVPVSCKGDVLWFEVNALTNPVISSRTEGRLQGVDIAKCTE